MKNRVWLPQIMNMLCNGCGDCADVCLPGALAIGQHTHEPFLANPEACTYCAACEFICPPGAIALPYQIVLAARGG